MASYGVRHTACGIRCPIASMSLAPQDARMIPVGDMPRTEQQMAEFVRYHVTKHSRVELISPSQPATRGACPSALCAPSLLLVPR